MRLPSGDSHQRVPGAALARHGLIQLAISSQPSPTAAATKAPEYMAMNHPNTVIDGGAVSVAVVFMESFSPAVRGPPRSDRDDLRGVRTPDMGAYGPQRKVCGDLNMAVTMAADLQGRRR